VLDDKTKDKIRTNLKAESIYFKCRV